MKPNRLLLLLISFLMFMPLSMAQVTVPQADIDPYVRGKEERLKSLNKAKFGMFIHWGPYAVLAGEWNGRKGGRNGEWIMFDMKIPRE